MLRSRPGAGAFAAAVRGAALIFLLVLLGSCDPASQTGAVLWTNHTEVASFVESFHAFFPHLRIEVEYHDRPFVTMAATADGPDIIVTDGVPTAETSRLLQDLSPLNIGREGRGRMYSALLRYGQIEGRQALLPVSFDLPVVVFPKGYDEVDQNRVHLDIGVIKQIASEFNVQRGGRYVRLGFSPLWHNSFVYLVARTMGASFARAPGGGVSWSRERLDEALAYLRAWTSETNGSAEAVKEFEDRYLYDPWNKLIDEDRVLFSVSSLAEFLESPSDRTWNLETRYISAASSIPVEEDVVVLALTTGPTNNEAAEQFARWLFSLETQDHLLSDSRDKNLDSFGIAGGFSSVIATNQELLPQYYPDLLGAIPLSANLDFPAPPPELWLDMKKDVVEPWLMEQLSPNPRPESLRDRADAWRRQQGE